MQAANLYEQYKSQSIQTLTRSELVVKLFEKASQQLSTAIFLAEQDKVRSFNSIVKTQKIMSALRESLDMNQAISVELNDIYTFILDKLYEVNIDSDSEMMKELLGLINDLKLSFKQAEKLARAQGFR